MKNFIYSVIILALLSFGVILQAQAEQTALEKIRELIKMKRYEAEQLQKPRLLTIIRKEAKAKGVELTPEKEIKELTNIIRRATADLEHEIREEYESLIKEGQELQELTDIIKQAEGEYTGQIKEGQELQELQDIIKQAKEEQKKIMKQAEDRAKMSVKKILQLMEIKSTAQKELRIFLFTVHKQ